MTLETAKLVDVQASQDERWIRTYDATFEVWVPQDEDPADYGVIATANAPGLPSIGTSYNLDGETDAWSFWTPYVKVSRRSTGDPGERQVYHVKMRASNKPMDREQEDQYDDPLLEPPKIDTTFTRFQRSPQKDVNNKPYENFNGEPIDGIQVDASRPQVNISNVNRTAHNLSQISEFMDCLNDATLWGLGKGKVKLSEHSMERLLYGTNTFYFKHSYGFEIRFDGWERKELHRGWYHRPGSGEPPVRFKDARNDFKNTQLNADGTANSTGTPVFLEFDDYDEKNLLLLGIPATF